MPTFFLVLPPLPWWHRVLVSPQADPFTHGLLFQFFPFAAERLFAALGVKPGIAILEKSFTDSRCSDMDDAYTAAIIVDIKDGDLDIFPEGYRRGKFLGLPAKCLRGFRTIDPIKPDLELLSALENRDCIAIGDAHHLP